jgi:hypothetical protein
MLKILILIKADKSVIPFFIKVTKLVKSKNHAALANSQAGIKKEGYFFKQPSLLNH